MDAGDAAISDDVRQFGQATPDGALTHANEEGELFHRDEFLLPDDVEPLPDGSHTAWSARLRGDRSCAPSPCEAGLKSDAEQETHQLISPVFDGVSRHGGRDSLKGATLVFLTADNATRSDRASEWPVLHLARHFPADPGEVSLNLRRARQRCANVRKHILGSHDFQEIGSRDELRWLISGSAE